MNKRVKDKTTLSKIKLDSSYRGNLYYSGCKDDVNEGIFCCPKCGKRISYTEKVGYECASCYSVFPIINETPIFTDNENYYFGEFSKDVFLDLIALSRQTSAQRALNAFLEEGKISKYAYNYGCNINRGNFFTLLKPSCNQRVLDLGCGWGNVSITLSRIFKQCFSMDLTKERVWFLMLRAKELGIKNIVGLCAGNMRFLPFADKSFDSVVMNGLLEWVPEDNHSSKPTILQRNYLKEVARILKDDGQFYLGIENRYALEYFQGMREDHTGMLYTSIMPRFLANIVSKKIRGKEYRTYTYSKLGYKRLLYNAGFKNVIFYIPWPNYRSFSTIFKEHEPENFIKHLKWLGYKTSWKTHLKSRLMPYLSHSYSIIANKNKKISWLEQFVEYLNQNYRYCYGSFKFPEICVTDTSGIGCIFKFKGSGRGIYISIPVDNLSLENNEKQYAHLEYLKKNYQGTEVDKILPELIGKDIFLGINYYMYKLIDIDRVSVDEVQKEICFQKLTSIFASKISNGQILQRNLEIGTIMSCINKCSIVLQDPSKFVEKYLLLLDTAGSLRHPAHGDLWPSNIIKDSETGKYFVIDWADFIKDGLPLQDLFHFFLYPGAQGKDRYSYMLELACNRLPTKSERKISYYLKTIYYSRMDYFTVERISSLFLLYLYENIVRRITRNVSLKSQFEKVIEITEKGPFPLPGFKRL